MIITNWDRIKNKLDNLSEPGVYLLYDDRGTCLYIGTSIQIKIRLYRHLAQKGSSPAGRFILRHKPASHFWPIVIVSELDAQYSGIILESILIQELNPLFNEALNQATPLTNPQREYYLTTPALSYALAV